MPSRLIKSRRVALPERRAARPEPAQSAQFYRQLAETIPHMAWAALPDGSTDFVNARVCEYTGRTHGQLIESGWRAVVHPDDWERCRALWTKAFKKGQPYELEYRIRRRDGRYLWHLGSAMPLREGGRIVRWFGTSTDIENQKSAERLLTKARASLETLVDSRAEEQRRDQQKRLRSFLDSMPAIAWIKDSRLRYLWISTSYARVHGKALGEMLGRDDFQIWPEPLAQHFRRDDEKALRANGPVQSVDTVPNSDGSKARWMVVKFPVPDSTGAFGVAGIGFDLATREHEFDGTGRLPEFPLDRLSARERQVLRLIVDGRTSAEVAETLGLSPKSVDTYRSRLMAKLEIEDMPGLVKFALRHGLTTTR